MDRRILPASKGAIYSGWALGILPCLFLLMSATFKFLKPEGFAAGLEHLGWNEGLMFNLGILEIACVIIYLITQTAVLGAILLTGYLGGATATHVRVGDPYFMPVLIGVALWLGLFLRDPRLRQLIPFQFE